MPTSRRPSVESSTSESQPAVEEPVPTIPWAAISSGRPDRVTPEPLLPPQDGGPCPHISMATVEQEPVATEAGEEEPDVLDLRAIEQDEQEQQQGEDGLHAHTAWSAVLHMAPQQPGPIGLQAVQQPGRDWPQLQDNKILRMGSWPVDEVDEPFD
eukprot:COSAG01_NODE_229_length_21089_cov_575.019194_17_plen_155_part_00